ncbi:unnamed protein product [Pleuronectes platessa]|uniref:Cadherin prodomain domain-containing protein n=1 Tax=Pleuronectes platessa TaxID=8262 RepID=A0A9N7YXU2_PLEPL|nr:unnamed protein product [Pleuronectes platessa]
MEIRPLTKTLHSGGALQTTSVPMPTGSRQSHGDPAGFHSRIYIRTNRCEEDTLPNWLYFDLSPTLRFEDCQRSREVGFVSSDPNFSVRPDGEVYAEQEVANLSEPVQFMVTARGLHDPHIWETTVKLALAGHPHSPSLTKVGIEEMLSRMWESQPRVIKFSRRHQRGSSANGLRRQKRDWVIPPINVPENSRGPFPHMLVRVFDDYFSGFFRELMVEMANE